MITCRQAERLFDAYLDKELSPSLAMELDAHRLGCEVCRQSLALLEACENVLINDSHEPGISTDFTDRLMSCFPCESARGLRSRRTRRILFVWGPALAAAAALALALSMAQWNKKSLVAGYKTQPRPFIESMASPIAEPTLRSLSATRDSASLLAEYTQRALRQANESLLDFWVGQQPTRLDSTAPNVPVLIPLAPPPEVEEFIESNSDEDGIEVL